MPLAAVRGFFMPYKMSYVYNFYRFNFFLSSIFTFLLSSIYYTS